MGRSMNDIHIHKISQPEYWSRPIILNAELEHRDPEVPKFSKSDPLSFKILESFRRSQRGPGDPGG
jgi:hypothetical protein